MKLIGMPWLRQLNYDFFKRLHTAQPQKPKHETADEGRRRVAIENALATGPTPALDEFIARFYNRQNWAHLSCHACLKEINLPAGEQLVEVIAADDGDMDGPGPVWICKNCLQQAMDLLQAPPKESANG